MIIALLRHTSIGDASAQTKSTAERLLDILERHEAWMLDHAELCASACFVFMRIIADGNAKPGQPEVRRRMIAFCVRLLRQRFAACATIGRDLVRLLMVRCRHDGATA